jgi:hypothetical protein
MRPLHPSHREAIREIFILRRPEYTTWQAAQLLRINVGEVLALIDRGTLYADVKRKRGQLGGPRHALIPWQELASIALLRWTVVQIHDALGQDADSVLPPLLRPAELKAVRLPEYLIRLLETLAHGAKVSLEEYIYSVLLGLEVTADPDAMEKLLPGFKAAIRFPDVEQ